MLKAELFEDSEMLHAETLPVYKPMPVTHIPYILDETEDFAVIFKPPRMHCAPLIAGGGGTLLDWYAGLFPHVMELCGRKKTEGGLLHRLDFETNGLVLFAKNQDSLDHLLEQQANGNFAKEYTAVCRKTMPDKTSAFPPPPVLPGFCTSWQGAFVIESYFRPFGPGSKQVRPVVDTSRKKVAKDQGGCYRTEVLSALGHPSRGGDSQKLFRFGVRLTRGFRHQVRCHLAWIGYPILNDPLYGSPGEEVPEGFLSLSANGLSFYDPGSGKPRKYRLVSLELPANSM